MHPQDADGESVLQGIDTDAALVESTEDLRAIAVAADAVTAATGLREAVQVARARGRSWNRIAVPLGVTAEQAREQFGPPRAD